MNKEVRRFPACNFNGPKEIIFSFLSLYILRRQIYNFMLYKCSLKQSLPGFVKYLLLHQ